MCVCVCLCVYVFVCLSVFYVCVCVCVYEKYTSVYFRYPLGHRCFHPVETLCRRSIFPL